MTGDVAVTPGQVLTVVVGGTPTDGDCIFFTGSARQCGRGFNGGGKGYVDGYNGAFSGGAAGGGATDLRVGGSGLSDRVVVAGGGGGGGASSCASGGTGGDAGAAGQTVVPAGACAGLPTGQGGGAGTQTSGGADGGSLGQGADTRRDDRAVGSGAGGGGLYGGGRGPTFGYPAGNGGGGGGSSLVPAGGTFAIDDSGVPGLVLTYVGPLPTLPANPCVTAGQTVTCTYLPTGTTRAFVVPTGVSSVHVVTHGAPGGTGVDSALYFPKGAAILGGRGAVVVADLAVSSGNVLYATVGGVATGPCRPSVGTSCNGGYNGGGSTGEGGLLAGSAGGGGASDIRVGGTGFADRVLVAAGGGGSGGSNECGFGGAGGDAGVDGHIAVVAGTCPSTHELGAGGGAGTATAGGRGAGSSDGDRGLEGVLGVGGDALQGHSGGGAGGGGLFGGGGGGGVGGGGVSLLVGGGGGGGGSSLVPTGGALGLDNSRTPKIVISYALPQVVAISGAPPAATVPQVYSHTFTLTGSPTPTLSVTEGTLPPGFMLNAAGALSGVALTAGTFQFTVTASNGVDSASLPVTFVVHATLPRSPTLVTATPGPESATVSWGSPIISGGFPLTSFTVTATPPSGSGLSPVSATVPATVTSTTLTGLTGGVTYSVAVIATTSFGSSAPGTTTVTPAVAVSISGTATTPATSGAPYSFTYTTTGSPTVNVASGALPPGLGLSTLGVLSGTPTTAGTYGFTVQAAPVSGAPVVSGPQSITVVAGAPATLTINGGNAQSTTATQPFAAPLSVVVKDANGNPVSGASVTFTVASGSAAFGASSSTTAISGVNGVATASALTAGRTAGAASVTASVTGSSSVSVSFAETVLSITAARADLAVTVGAPASIARGATGTVTVTVTNNGPNAAAAVVTGLQLGSNLRITAGGGGTVNRQGDAVAWTTSGLASGASVTFTVTVQAETARRPYSTSATGTVFSLVPDPSITNNTARATISAT